MRVVPNSDMLHDSTLIHISKDGFAELAEEEDVQDGREAEEEEELTEDEEMETAHEEPADGVPCLHAIHMYMGSIAVYAHYKPT